MASLLPMRALAQELATELVARTARLFAGPRPGLWTITVGGRPIGLLTREGDEHRLSWFEPADPRLKSYAGPIEAEIEALAAALSLRLGRQVELDSLPV